MNTIKSVGLFYCDGNSDKEYHASINEASGGYTVDFAYGRRGNALQTGTKTSSPVTLEAAIKIYDKLVQEKTSKGYTPSGDGKIFTATDKDDRITGLVPQLLNSIPEEYVDKYLHDNEWGAQMKHDGVRLLTKIKHNELVIGSNRKGLKVYLPQELENILLLVPSCELDGELVGETYNVFDCPTYPPPYNGYKQRHDHLHWLISDFILGSKNIKISPLVIGTENKINFFNTLKRDNAEGIVFKRLDSLYVPGRPASGGSQLKCKFYATATCLVTEINSQRSVKLAMSCGTAVGNVTIPPNKAIPAVGDLVEIRYLYAYKGGSLYQPTFLTVRDDIDTADSVDSLKFKSVDGDE